MQITRSSKKILQYLHSSKTVTDNMSPDSSLSNQNIPTIPTIHNEIIPMTKSFAMNISEKPISMTQDQMASESEPDLEYENDSYFSSYQSQGYPNIAGKQTFGINKYQSNIRRQQYSLHKSNQISQYIIIDDNKTVQNRHRQSKSVTNMVVFFPNKSSTSSLETHKLNKQIKDKKNISLMLKMIYQKQSTMQENIMMTRAKRTDKGGSVDLGLPDVDKYFYPIHYHSNRSRNSPKKKEKGAIVIQRWWRRILVLFKELDNKIVLIQSLYRGYLFRKAFFSMYDLDSIRKKKQLMHKYLIFALYLMKTIQLKFESSEHHVFHVFEKYKINKYRKEVIYGNGIHLLTCFLNRIYLKYIISAFKQKRFNGIIKKLHYSKKNRYINRWINNTIRFVLLKEERINKFVNKRTLINHENTTQIFLKSFNKWRTERKKNILSNEDSDINIKTKENIRSNRESNKKSRLKSNHKRILFKSLSSLNSKNSLLLKAHFYKWVRKTKTKTKFKKQIIKGKKKMISHILLKNICKGTFDKIKRESNRRKLISMFMHIRNLQTPTLAQAMEKIITYSDLRYQALNAYATFIQSYYRMKKSKEAILIQQIITKRKAYQNIQSKAKTEIEDSDIIHTNNVNNTQRTNILHTQYKTIETKNNYVQLNPQEIFIYLARRIYIKTIVYTFMVAC